jgi:hypothetical protein
MNAKQQDRLLCNTLLCYISVSSSHVTPITNQFTVSLAPHVSALLTFFWDAILYCRKVTNTIKGKGKIPPKTYHEALRRSRGIALLFP